jgi:hypothetical protein
VNADLRDYILSLPIDVRQALASIDEPCWYVSGYEDKRIFAASEVLAHPSAITDYGRPTFGHVAAYVPISPVAIALHAAKLGNFDTAQIRVSRHTSRTWSWVTTDPDLSVEWIGDRWAEVDAENDPTGHRAAIALLQKVMESPS